MVRRMPQAVRQIPLSAKSAAEQICQNPQAAAVVAAAILLLLRVRLCSAVIYTYDEEEVLTYLGRRFLIWGTRITLRLPAGLLERAATPRLMVVLSPVLLFLHPHLKLRIRAGAWEGMVPAAKKIHVTIPADAFFGRKDFTFIR